MKVGNYFFTRDKKMMIDLSTVRYYEDNNVMNGGRVCAANGRGSETRYYDADADDFISAMIEFAEGKHEEA